MIFLRYKYQSWIEKTLNFFHIEIIRCTCWGLKMEDVSTATIPFRTQSRIEVIQLWYNYFQLFWPQFSDMVRGTVASIATFNVKSIGLNCVQLCCNHFRLYETLFSRFGHLLPICMARSTTEVHFPRLCGLQTVSINWFSNVLNFTVFIFDCTRLLSEIWTSFSNMFACVSRFIAPFSRYKGTE